MYCLGKVRGLGYNGKLLVKGRFAPRLELEVLDKKMRIIGKVSRVFGPVDSPYVSIKSPINHKPSLDMVGKEVYVRDRSN